MIEFSNDHQDSGDARITGPAEVLDHQGDVTAASGSHVQVTGLLRGGLFIENGGHVVVAGEVHGVVVKDRGGVLIVQDGAVLHGSAHDEAEEEPAG